MGTKKTAKELETQALEFEKKAKQLRLLAKKQTEAEQAKLNSEIVKAVLRWRDSLPRERRMETTDIPEYFDTMTKKNLIKYGMGSSSVDEDEDASTDDDTSKSDNDDAE